MTAHFERSGPMTELTSYPQWAQDMVADCESAKHRVVNHELWDLMGSATLDRSSTANFMKGIWPVIERFPAYMALSLLKTRFGRSAGDDLARRWLVRNIRVEQNHAEYWLNWAEGAGVPRNEVLNGRPKHGTGALASWCEHICTNGSLAASIAASNYAVEGATGEWSQRVFDSAVYVESFPKEVRARSLRWLQLHAAYDDTHPWEALEIVCTLMGLKPAPDEVAHIGDCIKRSYASMCISMDGCMASRRGLWDTDEAAA